MSPVNANTDDPEARLAALWPQAQAGDAEAYRAALGLLAGRLRRWLRRRMQSVPDDVEDLVQECLLAVHLQRGTWEPAVSVERWALAIARHKLIDLWRRRGRREALHDGLDDLGEDALPAVVDDELPVQRDLSALLATLPVAQQQAIRLTKLDGLALAEAAAATGVSVAALKVQVHRGLKRLAALVRQAP